MAYIGKIIRLPDGQLAQLVPYTGPTKAYAKHCACASGCKSPINNIQYCSKDCQTGNCIHAVLELGQNIGRPMCECKRCKCDQAAYNENGTWFSKCDACHSGRHAPH